MSVEAPGGYRAVRALARALLAVFYGRIDVVGLEHVPRSGPLVVTANHPNALVDPMLLIATLPRRLTPVAKAPLFHLPLIAPLLRLAGAIPVERRQDPGSDPARNESALAGLAAALGRGGAVLIFPEGVSQPEPRLQALRTGAARMLLAAEAAAPARVTLLPVGLVFDEPGAFRVGRALVAVGPPVPTEDCVAAYGADPWGAVHRLTERIAAALQKQIVEAEDRETLRLLRAAERVWRHAAPAREATAAAEVEWLRRAARAYRYLRAHAPGEVARFRREVEGYTQDLDRLALESAQLAREYRAGAVLCYALREAGPLAAGLPLALLGLLLHAAPYWATALGVRVLAPEPDTEATYKVVGGLAVYPVAWTLEAAVAWAAGGGWALALVLAALVPSGFFALTWRERLRRFGREARGLLEFLARRDVRARLAARHRALAAELERLAALVPEPVLSGEPAGERA
jgi:1-acyl-sn-glycerol-3-phosphate acyltransferase